MHRPFPRDQSGRLGSSLSAAVIHDKTPNDRPNLARVDDSTTTGTLQRVHILTAPQFAVPGSVSGDSGRKTPIPERTTFALPLGRDPVSCRALATARKPWNLLIYQLERGSPLLSTFSAPARLPVCIPGEVSCLNLTFAARPSNGLRPA